MEEVWCRHKGEKNLSTYKTAKIESGLILSPAVDRIIVISFSQFFDLHPFDVRHWIHLSCWIIKQDFSPYFPPTLSFPSLFILSGRGSAADSPSHAELLSVITTRLRLCKHDYFCLPHPAVTSWNSAKVNLRAERRPFNLRCDDAAFHFKRNKRCVEASDANHREEYITQERGSKITFMF